MRLVSALVIGAAAYLQLGGFIAVQAATCADPIFSCTGDTAAKDPLPEGDCNVDANVTCTTEDCCGEANFLVFRHAIQTNDDRITLPLSCFNAPPARLKTTSGCFASLGSYHCPA